MAAFKFKMDFRETQTSVMVNYKKIGHTLLDLTVGVWELMHSMALKMTQNKKHNKLQKRI